ncbi:MAG TPA: BON domain-containing protein [Terriglobales bacterium]|nr:BON domain-containing protein [Terriglobales bacterium]
MNKVFPLAMLVFLLLSGLCLGQDNSQQVPADNTKVNQRDRSQNEPTADQQKENSSDRELARQVRRAIVKDKSLSTDAHNVKIIAQNGSVTLKGPVKSEEEKQALESKAAEIAGAGKVNSELQVAPSK